MKRGQVNEFETYIPIKVDLERFFLEEGTNKVLVKVFKKDVEQTVGGIYTSGIESHNFAKNTERRGEVIKTVDKIYPGQNGIDIMLHDCDVEIQVGDIVYFNYFDNINSFIYEYKGEIYKLIPYSAIILAIRGEETIMCNGYLLLEERKQEQVGGIIIPEEFREKEYYVKYLGSLNRRYFQVILYHDVDRVLENNPDKNIYNQFDYSVLLNRADRTDDGTEILQVGDKVLINDMEGVFPLEEYAYARFDNRKVYYVCPRHRICSIVH